MFNILFSIGKRSARKIKRNQSKSNTTSSSTIITISRTEPKVILDGSFVAEYMHRQAEKDKENQTPVELSDSEDSVEFVGTKMASPVTKRMAKFAERLSKLEKENRNLRSQNHNLQEEVKGLKEAVFHDQLQANAVQNAENVIILNNPVQPSTSAAIQTETSANVSIEANKSDFGFSYDENWANGILQDMIASGEINEIAETILNDLK